MALEAGTSIQEEVINYDKERRPYWVELNIAPIMGPNGVPTHFIASQRDTTKRKDQEKALREARDKAEEMNRLKTAFLEMMSHELRTPLVGIIGFSDLLQLHEDEEVVRFAELIRKGGDRLDTTLDSILNLAQLESGAVELLAEPTLLDEVLSELVSDYMANAVQKGLELTYQKGLDEPVFARLDRGAFRRVVQGLLTNALKFTEVGHVTVRLDVVEHEVCIAVQDTGIGIDKAFLPKVFDAFHQESYGTARQFEGNGLGLTVVRLYTERMGGRITCESVKREGTTMRLYFPRWYSPRRTPSRTLLQSLTSGDQQRRLLVVDDQPDVLHLVDILLKKQFTLTLASSYDDALYQAKTHMFDLMMIDINLRDQHTGEDLMRRLREDPQYAATPMIACTAYAAPSDRHRLLESGFDAYLSKPFRHYELTNLIVDLINQQA